MPCMPRPIESLIRDFGMARQLKNNQDLARFVIQGEANGRQLGTGSYGSVEEVSLFIAQLPVSRFAPKPDPDPPPSISEKGSGSLGYSTTSYCMYTVQCNGDIVIIFVDNNQRFGVCREEDS